MNKPRRPIDESLDYLCCDYKDCGHGCSDGDECSACAGRGDCGEGRQLRPTSIHAKDSDCGVDPETATCTTCGVDHSGECLTCQGRGFHEAGCPQSDEVSK